MADDDVVAWRVTSRLDAWFEVPRLSALRQALPAVAVGTALAVHKGVDFAWYGAVLALAGIAVVAFGSQGILERVVGGVPAAGSPAIARRHLGIAAGAAACLTAIAWGGGEPVLMLYLAGALLAAGLLPRGIPVAWRSYLEAVARIGLTIVAVGIAYLAQGGPWSPDMLLAGAQLGLLATVLAVVHGLRDRGRDLRSGRRTVTARFGVTVGQYQAALLCLLPFTMNICWLLAGSWAAALLTLVALPLALWVIRDVHRTVPGPILNVIRPQTAGLHLVFALLLAIGLLL